MTSDHNAPTNLDENAALGSRSGTQVGVAAADENASSGSSSSEEHTESVEAPERGVAASVIADTDETPLPALVDHGVPDAAVPFWRRPIPSRFWISSGVVAALGVAMFGAGVVVGEKDPLLAPVRISAGPANAGATTPERVYAAAKDAVVTIEVPGGGTGSGFFYRPDRIVTNDHVVATSAQVAAQVAAGHHPKVIVVLANGRGVEAKVLAVDTRLDIAILATPHDLNIRPLSFADSATLSPGQPAIVVGSPFGLTTSVSTGVVSGVGRSGEFAENAVQNQLIQTDAAINPGNSGGPLLDASAGVVGIVTLRPDEEDNRPTQGLAFALPSNQVVAAIDQLERHGKVSHAQLGVSLSDHLSVDGDPVGALVTAVTADSPAAKAGVQVGDEIVAIDDETITTAAEVIARVSVKRAGDELELKIKRDSTYRTLTATLIERTVS